MTFLKRLLAALALVSLATPAYAQISTYSTTAASNATVDGTSATNIAEGNAPGTINNAIRQIMADIASDAMRLSGTQTVSGAKSFDANATFAGASTATVKIGTTTEGAGIGFTPRVTIRATADTNGYGMVIRTTNGAGYEALDLWNDATSGDNSLAVFRTDNTASIRGSIDYNRAGTAVRYNTTSDERLKQNIANAAPAGAVIDAIQVRSFDWREGGGHTDYGFIAQELVEHVPDAVRVGDSGEAISDPWAVDYSKLVPLLVKEVQALRARVAVLEAQ